jgi:hypothetical protein
MLGILNNTFKPILVQKFSSIKVYNALVLQILLFEIEICILRKKDKKLLSSIEMKVFIRTARYPFLTTKGMKKFWKS